MHPIRPGYYENPHKRTYIAITYTTTSLILLLNETPPHHIPLTTLQTSPPSFTLPPRTKPTTYTYDPTTTTITTQRKKTTTILTYVATFPNMLPASSFLAPFETDQIFAEMKEHGCVVVKKVYDRELLRRVLVDFGGSGQGGVSTYGWYSSHKDKTDDIGELIEALLVPICGVLDRLLGEGMWESNGRLQVGSANRAKKIKMPNYHVDQMWLKKGLSFDVLVGIPLVGDFDKALGGQLGVYCGSHLRLKEQLLAYPLDEVKNGDDKQEKIRRYCGLDQYEATALTAMPGDVYMCHYRTIHGVGHNFEKERSVAYLRIRSKRSTIKGNEDWVDEIINRDPFEYFIENL